MTRNQLLNNLNFYYLTPNFMNLNKAMIVGRITRDPEIKTTTSGHSVVTIGVATNRFYKNAQGEKQEETEFHNVVAWGRLAEIIGEYLKKGQLAFFEGRLQTRSWEGQDGIKRWRTEIIAENMQLGPRAGEGAGSAPSKPSKAGDDLPTIQRDEPISPAPASESVDVESIPF